VNASSRNQHRPWCTDHLGEVEGDPLTEGQDSCVTAVFLFEDATGAAGVGVFADQDPDQAEPGVHIEVSLSTLTPAQARQVHAALGEILDRIAPPASPAAPWHDTGSGPGAIWSTHRDDTEEDGPR
jgi:hypothetical protein